jgi:hypothetical protein
LTTVGVFASFFPDPRGGFELGVMAAVARAELVANAPVEDVSLYSELTGPGVAAWASYNGWVSANWSLGAMLRGSAGWMTGNTEAWQRDTIVDIDTRAAARSIVLCFDAMYH